MKVGILTFPNSISYGASLQMHALYRAVEQLGHQPEIINYHNEYMKKEKHMRGGRSPLKSVLKTRVRMLMHHRLYQTFSRFEKQHLKMYPARPFTDARQLPTVGRRYDAVICGSDQVWNPRITNGDLSYFLDFCTEDTKRVAYAPSFGVEEFAEGFLDAIAPELRRFHALSARELPGKQLVELLTHRETPLVTDPTWLMDVSDWEAMEKPHPAADGEYVLYFVVSQSEKLLRRCKAFAKKHGLKIVMVGGNPLTARRNRDPMFVYATDVGPQQWLYLIHHARDVFTNSFHGTAFSVLFEREVYVQVPAHNGSRLRQVLERMEMQDHEVREEEELTEAPVDYDRARVAFAQLREQSLAYLKDALQ